LCSARLLASSQWVPSSSRSSSAISSRLKPSRWADFTKRTRIYASKRAKFVQHSETGERKQIEIATRVKPWWWKSPTGKVVVAVRYGAARIELAKGKNAIEVGSMGDLVAALEAVKEAVAAGELDSQIEQASGALRAGFAKKK